MADGSPGAPLAPIEVRASRLAARATAPKHYRHWTPKEDARLRLLWGEDTLAKVAEAFGRTPLNVYLHGRKLGLPCGCAQGFEYLSAAAKRTGFGTEQLREILASAGVGLRVAFTRPCKKRGRRRFRHFHVVEPDAVDRAVELWAKTEIVNSAAERRGLIGETLRTWLIKAGHRPPEGRYWRLPSSVIDEVVATHRSLATITTHAKRRRMSRQTLAKHLRAAGVIGVGKVGNKVLLTSEAVTRALKGRRVRRIKKGRKR